MKPARILAAPLLASAAVVAMCAFPAGLRARMLETPTASQSAIGSSTGSEHAEAVVRMREIVHVQVIPGLPIPIVVIGPPPASPPAKK